MTNGAQKNLQQKQILNSTRNSGWYDNTQIRRMDFLP